jgi:hypothetical protein
VERDDGIEPQPEAGDFGKALEAFLGSRLVHINNQLTDNEYRPNKTLNKLGFERLAQLPKGRLRQLFVGGALPDPSELLRILALAGAKPTDRELFVRRLSDASHRAQRQVDASPARALSAKPYYRPEDDLLFEINRWTAGLPLREERLRVHLTQAPEATASPLAERIEQLAAEFDQRFKGQVVCGAAIGNVDWNETEAGDDYEVWVRLARYTEAIAQRQAMNQDRASLDQARGLALLADWPALIRFLPFCALAAQIGVVTSDGQVLAVQRSSKVANYRREWSLGVNETIKAMPEGDQQEDFFSMSRRGLYEELAVGLNISTRSASTGSACVSIATTSTSSRQPDSM